MSAPLLRASCHSASALHYNQLKSRGFSGGRMSDQSAEDGYEAAAARFDRAFSRLEASVRSLNGRMRAHARIEADTAKLVNDRARLAGELEKTSAKARRLDDSAGEVARRLVVAMESVREVLQRDER